MEELFPPCDELRTPHQRRERLHPSCSGDWKQSGTDLVFIGPHSAQITVTAQKVPDGYPLQDYFGQILRSVRDNSVAAEATVVRRTQLQDVEAREIFLELDNTDGEQIRSTTWITITGPLALTINFQAPVAHAAELSLCSRQPCSR